MATKTPIANAFIAARQSSGLSVPDLAEKAGLSRQGIWRIEAGQRPDPLISTLRAVTRACGGHFQIDHGGVRYVP
jgi:transcriptional regulator with XRE-family HTH domain